MHCCRCESTHENNRAVYGFSLSYPSVQSMMRYVGALAAVLPHSVLETICIMIALALTKRANENEAYLIKGCSIKSSAPGSQCSVLSILTPPACHMHSSCSTVSLVAVRGFAHTVSRLMVFSFLLESW